MHAYIRRALLALVSTFLLAFAAGPASAIEVDPAGAATATATEMVMASEGGFINPGLTCDVEINMTLSSSMVQVTGSRVGSVRDFRFVNCSGGRLTTVNTGDWPIFYGSINLSSFPKLMNVLLESVQAKGEIAGVDCDIQGRLFMNFRIEGAPLVLYSFHIEPDLTLRKIGGDLFCPDLFSYEAEGPITRQTMVL